LDERIGMQNPHTAAVRRTSSLGASELHFYCLLHG